MRTLRKGLAISVAKGTSVAQLRLTLRSELHTLLTRWQQILLLLHPPLLLPQPELFAAMATVRDGLAVRPGTWATHPSSRPLPRAHLHTHLD